MKDYARIEFFKGKKSPSIARGIGEKFPEAERWPDERTVRNWTDKWSADQSEDWEMGEHGDSKVILPILRELISVTEGRVRHLTNHEAEELTRLGHAVRDMPAIGMYHWARARISARVAGEPVAPLLHYLAFSPWLDKGQGYLMAFGFGWVDEMRAFCPDDEAWLATDAWRNRGGFSIGAVIVDGK